MRVSHAEHGPLGPWCPATAPARSSSNPGVRTKGAVLVLGEVTMLALHRRVVARLPVANLADLAPAHEAIFDQPEDFLPAGTYARLDEKSLVIIVGADDPTSFDAELARVRLELELGKGVAG